jgi:peptidoglycan-N-acetylglucosamine deacetylase
MSSRRAILLFAAVAPVIALLILRISWPAAVAIVFVSHMLLLYPTLRATSQWLGPVVTTFATENREVWLTIDDGPGEETGRLLDLLSRHGVRATFFLIGSNIDRYPEVVRQILARGHSVGNHSATHPSGSFWILGPSRLAREIDDCSRSIEAAAGQPSALFRAPVGMKNPFVHPLLRSRGLQLIAWSARAFDTVLSPERCADRIRSAIFPGAIVLLHEGSRAVGGGEIDLRGLEATIVALKEDGYDFVIPAESQLRAGRRAVTT